MDTLLLLESEQGEAELAARDRLNKRLSGVTVMGFLAVASKK